MSKTKGKQIRCPKGTRKNKKTGLCEPNIKGSEVAAAISVERSRESSKESSKGLSKKSDENKENWENVSSKIQQIHNGKTYTFIVIPENTFVYRGFMYGENPDKSMSKEEIKELDEENKMEYKARKNAGIYFANLGVATYYAYNPDRGNRWKHTVLEYKTKRPLYVLDMSVWQNIKNIVDDSAKLLEKNDELPDDITSIFEATHDFDIDDPEKKLYRDSGGSDDEMTQIMITWLSLKSSPKLDGFGHLMMPGFHSEFTCIKPSQCIKLFNEYCSDNYVSRELVSIKKSKDVIDLTDMYFMSENNTKPFKIVDLLK